VRSSPPGDADAEPAHAESADALDDADDETGRAAAARSGDDPAPEAAQQPVSFPEGSWVDGSAPPQAEGALTEEDDEAALAVWPANGRDDGVHDDEPHDDGVPDDGTLRPVQDSDAPAGPLRLWRALPGRAKIAGGCSLSAVVGALVAAVVTRIVGGPNEALAHPTFFVREAAHLRAGPDNGDAFPVVALLERGEPVQRLDSAGGSVGGFVLVRDSVGLVGFVPRESLQPEAPSFRPGEPFTRCSRRPVESGTVPCVNRAQAQLEACARACREERADPGPCEAGCAKRRDACAALCVAPPAAPLPEARAVPAAPAAAPPPAHSALPEQAEVGVSGSAPAHGARARKKRRRVKRKKRRRSGSAGGPTK
jgi:hypothetical protein